MNTLLWIGALLLVGLLVIVLEVFVPSGGILGLVSVVALVAAVVMAFAEQGVALGMAVLAVVAVAVPTVLTLAFRWFPETPLGRRVLPPPPGPADVVPGGVRRAAARGMVGHTGRTVGDLLPWGQVEIDGRRWEAVSESGPLDGGTTVRVVGVRAAAVVVRGDDMDAGAAAEPEPAAGSEPPGDREPSLSRVLEEFDFDRLDPPPA